MPRYMSPKEKKEEKKEVKGMVDLKLPPLKKSDLKVTAPIEPESGDQWPWGMRLHFEAEQCDKIPSLKNMKVNQKVNIEAIGEVVTISMHEEEKGKERYSVEIQLHKIGVN